MGNNVQPQNLEAEWSVLGAILTDNEATNRVLEILNRDGDEFYIESHQRVFRAMIDLADRGEPIDLITLGDLLKSRGELDGIGGTATLAQFNEKLPTAVNVTHYARIVKEHAQRRKLISTLRGGLNQAYSLEDPAAITGALISKLVSLQSRRPQEFHIRELLPAVLNEIERAYENKGRIVGVPTGLKEFENSYGGISRGDLVLIGGRTSMGKTSFATCVGKNAAEQGYPLAFVSAESPPAKIVLRLLSQASGVENVRLHAGILRDGDFGKLTNAACRLAKLPVWFLGSVRSWETIKVWLRGD
jgi:replicative DNA helicase